MKVTVLGYQSPFPGANSCGPGYLLEHNHRYYLIDAGSGVLSKLQQYIKFDQLEAVFLSHLHHDHMSDFLVLQYAIQMEFVMKGRTKPLPVYFPQEPKPEASIIPFQHFIQPHHINESTMLQLDDLQISFLQTDHVVPTYAMKFQSGEKTFVYGADSGIYTSFSPFAKQADLLILECTYLEKDRPLTPMGHLSTSDVAKLSRDLQPKKLMVTHFYPEYDPKKIEEELIHAGIHGTLLMPMVGQVIEV
ncbi:MBL fold metallo-hydrolase [Tepidibacillus fermentans]|uniref:Ribonuclease BN (tRNA processing enzyme) n=1 Tax=Tepidibacillus fermentans TaxID=1281767 RepID=A0A4R3KIV8_9BACI|nr:MBL fold metallo-hydrolase [Tepidibacillus fermentans]TCS83030.1 ribonuclease BN (tRNA processing enzyme) [Tepidibacillus fermentans]